MKHQIWKCTRRPCDAGFTNSIICLLTVHACLYFCCVFMRVSPATVSMWSQKNQPWALLTAVMTQACTLCVCTNITHTVSLSRLLPSLWWSFKQALLQINRLIWLFWAIARFQRQPCVFSSWPLHQSVRDKDAEDSCYSWQLIYVHLCSDCRAI